ncbi:rhodanese-like domain-containing protein [Neobacillus notoginsengisoli]|uniref:Rhodanese-like domain-containing protein n=1 Tax=Neobacillus notoginsengisoli TaxID=1578198 RepID=A0A417YVF3_9BACI|nr:rhodanese-like domain-containing protein [Neobacillus notoginsengisoli]RHW41307.1 rhodanese-like domain-containing protein [Neobacillus notoginsengisoli]
MLIVLVFLLVSGCSSASYKTVSVDEAMKMIENGSVKVLDVRTPEEYNSGHIPGSKLIPLQVIDGLSEQLDKNQQYLIVCRSGNRSQQASELLTAKGYEVLNMAGGMNEWSGEVEQ